MEAVDPSKQDRFCNSFHDEAHEISQGLYASLDAAIDGHQMKWAEFCQDVALNSLLVSYRDPVPIFNTFARQY